MRAMMASMRFRRRVGAAVFLAFAAVSAFSVAAQQPAYRTLNDRFAPPAVESLDTWKARAAYLREHVLASAGLLPMPEKTPLGANVFGDVTHDDYVVSKVYFESLPGFFVTGNLYRPRGGGPFPAIASPHGHWTYGRLENTDLASVPGRAINLARQGFVVFTYDMIGYDDSRQLTHTFGGRRENLWGLSLAGLQLWNGIRVLDFFDTLPYVRHDGYGATGASGGGTQTFLLAAVDDRVAVAAPVNMISLHMQGGCLCENLPGLRLDTTNVEIAGTIAPRPLLMVSATGDWTAETMELEYPAMRRIYELFGAASHVHALRIDAPHNYNKDSREAMYAWMARWLQHADDAATRPERSFHPDPLADLMVFYGRPLPANAATAAELTDRWIAGARSQLTSASQDVRAAALRHALGFAAPADTASPAAPPNDRSRTVLLASADAQLAPLLRRAGFTVEPIAFTPFDAIAAAKIAHFETYNRTAASQRVADIVSAVRRAPSAALVADGDAALAGLLAAAVVPLRRAVLDVAGFDPSSDDAFVEHLYIPGLRRAGDLQTAASLVHGDVTLHGANPALHLTGVRAETRRLSAAEIVARLRVVSSGSR
jgi:dienelactone hydrolase